MTTRCGGAVRIQIILWTCFLLVGPASQPLLGQASRDVTESMVEQWMTDLSNWGRWGDDDQLGTLNLITPEKRLQASSLVRVGTSVSLSHNYLKERAADATSPFVHEMSGVGGRGVFVGDRYSISYHGYAHSHLDALCHMMHEGRLYNGYVRDDEVTEAGCNKLAIINFKQGIVTRGILMDIARLKGVEYLEPGTPIYVEDLEAWEQEAGIRVGSGDIVLVRSGRWARRAEVGPWATGREAAGLHASVVPWLRERGVAILGSDYTNDVLPSGVEGVTQPVHQLMLVALGTPLFDNLDLEAVAAEAARQGRWEFMLVAAPLAVEGGTGSPLNPLAIF
ncbi:MAG: cyclase [Gemmatimonadetes bacterium]|nr:cyclase [Gemmatimonadota bacterium]MCH2463535.1 cyclase family protein [Gemmatimonadota bacterium]HAD74794.1 cyclase [Gemmatimonadota bacterium]